MNRPIVHYLNPWKARRERAAERLAALRQRDGDNCARCRRPLRFDVPEGSDLAAKVEQLGGGKARAALADLCLTHVRCHAQGRDLTDEVLERLRPNREAELFAKKRKRKAA